MFPFVEDHNRWSLFLMLLKCHHVPHLVVESKIVAYQDSYLDIFKIIVETNEPTKELVNRALEMFKWYQVDAKNLKCLLKWWEKHESLFSIVIFFTNRILGIVRFQIETKKIFSLFGIFQHYKSWFFKKFKLINLSFFIMDMYILT